jgi:LDH2 family malate/lactate/ureidoglycolate dehydrogenase
MDDLVAHIKASERVEGVEEIFVPGERGQRRAAALRRAGEVPIDAHGWQTLEQVCASVDVPLPVP